MKMRHIVVLCATLSIGICSYAMQCNHNFYEVSSDPMRLWFWQNRFRLASEVVMFMRDEAYNNPQKIADSVVSHIKNNDVNRVRGSLMLMDTSIINQGNNNEIIRMLVKQKAEKIKDSQKVFCDIVNHIGNGVNMIEAYEKKYKDLAENMNNLSDYMKADEEKAKKFYNHIQKECASIDTIAQLVELYLRAYEKNEHEYTEDDLKVFIEHRNKAKILQCMNKKNIVCDFEKKYNVHVLYMLAQHHANDSLISVLNHCKISTCLDLWKNDSFTQFVKSWNNKNFMKLLLDYVITLKCLSVSPVKNKKESLLSYDIAQYICGFMNEPWLKFNDENSTCSIQ